MQINTRNNKVNLGAALLHRLTDFFLAFTDVAAFFAVFSFCWTDVAPEAFAATLQKAQNPIVRITRWQSRHCNDCGNFASNPS